MWLIVGLAAIIILGHQSGSVVTAEDDRSIYVCYNGKCVTKATLEDQIRNSTYFQSMENCRLLCGKNGNLWPLPTISGELGNELVVITPENIELETGASRGKELDYINKVFNIFRDTMVDECGSFSISKTTIPVKINVRVQNHSLVLTSSTNEEYQLSVNTNSGGIKCEIEATSVYGARHAFETLSQLTGRWKLKEKRVCNIYMLTSARIIDRPIFNHRGILVDTSRNFIPLKDLKRIIRAMGANKLNVFHWHATDTHSFPLLINRVPALAEMGAYSAEEVYTEDDIKDLTEYARLRGVRILMEIDSPAHAGNGWQFGAKQGLGNLVVCRNKDPWRSACVQPPCGQLNPANPNVYKVLGELYSGLNNIFQNDMFHMGGDEVHLGCWNQSEEIVEYMMNQKYPRTTEGFMKLWTEFHRKALKVWDKVVGHSRTKIVLWTSDLTNPATIAESLDKSRFIIEAWTDQFDRIPHELLQMGYEIIFATTDVWYLDHGFWGRTLYHTWKNVYDYQIPEDPKVLGGEAALWSEYVDVNNLDNKLWPRGAALAERLWTSPTTSSEEAQYRLLEMRQRLLRRGIQVDQVIPQWCYLNEGLC